LKTALILLVVVLGIAGTPAYADEIKEFGYVLLPDKLLENTYGTIQIFVESNNTIVPDTIQDLTITSSDSSIVKVVEVTNEPNNFLTTVKIQAINPGQANMALAAPGFYSEQIQIPVFTNNNYPSQILMKLTPNDFSIDGPKFGYLGVELATTDGLPTRATEDTIVKVTSPNKDVIVLESEDAVIKKGEYFSVSKFSIKNSGDAIVFAESEGMNRISEVVHVRLAEEPLRVQLYVLPEIVNSLNPSKAYAIIQLQDANGIPIIAEEDVIVSIQATNPDSEINTSNDFEEIVFDSDEITIKEGTYWGYTHFTPRKGLESFTLEPVVEYSINISTENYVSRGATVNVINEEALIGKEPVILRTLPILATGQEELIGVAYLMAEDVQRGNEPLVEFLPVLASDDLDIQMDSSNTNAIKIIDPQIEEGHNAALVFGKVGTVIPDTDDDLELSVLSSSSDNQIVTAVSYGPKEDNLELKVEQIIPKVLSESNFPILGYLIEVEDEDETEEESEGEEKKEDGRLGVTHYIEDTVLSFSANEYVSTEPQIIKKDQAYGFFNAESTKIGTSTLTATGGGFEATTEVTSLSTDPVKIHLTYPKTFLPENNNLIAVQVLDIIGNPVYAKEDIDIRLVPNDVSKIEVPELVSIKKGEYNSFFEIKTKNEGNVELATLAEDLPLAKFDFEIKGVKPEITIKTLKMVRTTESFDVVLNVAYPGFDLPLEGANVTWEIKNAEIKKSDTSTDKKGNAIITLTDARGGTVSIDATVNGLGFAGEKVSKKVKVLEPEQPLKKESDFPLSNFFESGPLNSNMIFLILPFAGVAVSIFLKKTNRIEGIMDKLNFEDKIDEIKERISEIRDR